jgi:cell wall-associated NlpC family hydrolase
MVYKINGQALKRDAYQQAEQGQTLSFIEESEPGDLAFFDDREGKIVHVGMLLENHHIIHAHGKVRIDRIDQTGIFNSETQTHSHQLRIIKKVWG